MMDGWNIKRVLVNGLDGDIVIDDAAPVFTITAEGSDGTETLWLQLRLCLEGGEVVWDSGEIPFSSPHITYGGPKLTPKTKYALEVRACSCTQQICKAQTVFSTGFMGTSWQATWIEPVQKAVLPEKEVTFYEQFATVLGGHVNLHPVQQLKRVFNCETPPKQAFLYASAHGVYELAINGVRVGNRLLAPETSAYGQILYYQSYDVAKYLRAGENELTVLLADGWWAGRIGLSGASCQYGDKLGFIMEMDLRYANGSTEKICSDRHFAGRESHIAYSDLFIGEKWDLTKPPSGWQNCVEAEYSMDNLIAQPLAPVVEMEPIAPMVIFTAPNGDLLYDFGQVISGVPRLVVHCDAISEITLDFGETLDAEGNFLRNIMGRNKDQRDVLVCSPGKTEFQPKFTYHGFRYMRVAGATQENLVSALAVPIGTKIAETGSFKCSDDLLNQLQHNISWSIKGNLLSVPTDCPQREKMGWTGDLQVIAKTACFNYDLRNFLSAWLLNMRAEQKPDGEIPNYIPNYPISEQMHLKYRGNNSSAAWGDACVLAPYYLYGVYGDKRVLWDNLQMMEGWLDFIGNAAAKPPGGPYLWTAGHHFGDWLIPSFSGTHDGIARGVAATKEVVSSCFYAITVSIFIKVLDALLEDGQPQPRLLELKQKYSNLLPKIKEAVCAEHISDDGIVAGDLQGLYVIVLQAQIVQGQLRQKVANRLTELVRLNGNRLDTGFVSVSHLLDVLIENGHREAAYALLHQKECPSWLYQITKGATTIWEHWDAVAPDGSVRSVSFNHYAFGAVGDWIYRTIGGIAPGAPGYRKIVFRPDIFCGLEYSECSFESAYGTIVCNWRKDDNAYVLSLKVPGNTEAHLKIADNDYLLKPGAYEMHFDENGTLC